MSPNYMLKFILNPVYSSDGDHFHRYQQNGNPPVTLNHRVLKKPRHL